MCFTRAAGAQSAASAGIFVNAAPRAARRYACLPAAKRKLRKCPLANAGVLIRLADGLSYKLRLAGLEWEIKGEASDEVSVTNKGDMVNGGFRNDVFAAAFETLSPKGREQDDEVYEKWVNHTIELAQLVQRDKVLSMLEKFNLLERGLKGVERAGDEKMRIVAKIMKEPRGE